MNEKCGQLMYIGFGETEACGKEAVAFFDLGKPGGFPVCSEHARSAHPSRITPLVPPAAASVNMTPAVYWLNYLIQTEGVNAAAVRDSQPEHIAIDLAAAWAGAKTPPNYPRKADGSPDFFALALMVQHEARGRARAEDFSDPALKSLALNLERGLGQLADELTVKVPNPSPDRRRLADMANNLIREMAAVGLTRIAL